MYQFYRDLDLSRYKTLKKFEGEGVVIDQIFRKFDTVDAFLPYSTVLLTSLVCAIASLIIIMGAVRRQNMLTAALIVLIIVGSIPIAIAQAANCMDRLHSDLCFRSGVGEGPESRLSYHNYIRFECPEGSYIGRECICVENSELACYHERGCQYPKIHPFNYTLPTNFSWHNYEIEQCKSGEECIDHKSQFIIDFNGDKRFVKKMEVFWKEVPYNRTSKFATLGLLSGPVRGDKTFCANMNSSDCVSNLGRLDLENYSFMRGTQRYPVFKADHVIMPIYCYGHSSIRIPNPKRERRTTECFDCMARCDEQIIEVYHSLEPPVLMTVCGKSDCFSVNSSLQHDRIDRSLNSKLFDSLLTLTIDDSTIRRDRWSTSLICPKVDICEAINCVLCQDLLMNMHCWKHTFIAIVLLIIQVVSYLLYKCIMKCLRRIKRQNRNQSRTPDSRRHSSNTQEVPENVELEVLNEQEQARAPGWVPRNQMIMGVLPLLGLLQMVTGEGCHVTDLFSSPDLMCDQGTCLVSSRIELDLKGIGLNHCIKLMTNKSENIGNVNIKLNNLYFSCTPRTLFWTKEHIFKTDYVEFCPLDGTCTTDWCSKVDEKTQISGLTWTPNKVVQYCRLGPACWANNCLFCGWDSCRVVRYYPESTSKSEYMIQTCDSWKLMANVSFSSSWYSENETFLLEDAEHFSLGRDVSGVMRIGNQGALPILAKNFIVNETHSAFLDSILSEPVSGTISQLLCDREFGEEDLAHCSFPKEVCNCQPERGSACVCTKTQLSSYFTRDTVLPISSNGYRLVKVRNGFTVSTGDFAHARVELHVRNLTYVQDDEPVSCFFKPIMVRGCYDCINGADLAYQCTSKKEQTSIINCDKIRATIECDPYGDTSSTKLLFNQPTHSINCQVDCSNETYDISTDLHFVPRPTSSDSYIPQLIHIGEQLGFSEQFLHSLGNLNIIGSLIGGVKILFVVVLGYIIFRISILLLKLIPKG